MDTKSLERFASSQKTLLDNSQKIADLFQQLKPQEIETIQTIRDKLRDQSLRVVVLGGFKRGKSTFINSLLGEEILPNFATPCTAVINEIKYGEEKKAVVHFRPPGAKLSFKKVFDDLPPKVKKHLGHQGRLRMAPLEIKIEELPEYVVIKNPGEDDPNGSIHDLPYDHVEIFWPLDLLKNGVVIIDSPGLDECESRTEITNRYLKNADAILFVLSCSQLASQTETEFIDNSLISNGYEDMLFICNRFDEVRTSERERVMTHARQKLGGKTSYGAERGIHFLSAASALEAKINNDSHLLSNSGLPQLQSHLERLLIEGRGRTKLLQPARLMLKEITSVVTDTQSRGSAHLEKRTKLVHQLNDYIRVRNEFAPPVREEVHRISLELKNGFDIVKETFANNFDQAINATWYAVNQFSPPITIGMGALFSNDIDRRRRINEVAADVYPRVFHIVNEQMNIGLEASYESFLEHAKKVVRADLYQFMDKIVFYLTKIYRAIHPEQSEQEQSLTAMATAFEAIQKEHLAEKEKEQSPPFTDEVVPSQQGGQFSPDDEVPEVDLIPYLKYLGAEDSDFYASFERFFPFAFINYFSFINLPIQIPASTILGQLGFDYLDRTATTNTIKTTIGSYLLDNINEYRNNILLEHFKGWDEELITFAMAVRSFFNSQIAAFDAEAETIFREELLNSDQVSLASQSALKDIAAMREQIEETIFDLVGN